MKLKDVALLACLEVALSCSRVVGSPCDEHRYAPTTARRFDTEFKGSIYDGGRGISEQKL
jgi:hypothetical protein